MNKACKKYYIQIADEGEYAHAGTKARKDCAQIMREAGYAAIAFRAPVTSGDGLRSKLRVLMICLLDWIRLCFSVAQGSVVVMQYPHYPVKSARLMTFVLPVIRGLRGCRFIALIHDLNAMRSISGEAARYADTVMLKRCDAWIAHNERMKAHMVSLGFEVRRIQALGIFDYLTGAPVRERAYERPLSVVIAGNFDPLKCRYLYELLPRPKEYVLHLYGPNYDSTASHPNVVYHGVVPAEELPGQIRGSFGLVWDGDSVETCGGEYGNYLRYNNPHKASLYLASGLPVLVWKQAAIAPALLDDGAAIAIESLSALEEALDALSADQYQKLARGALRAGVGLRNGEKLKAVLP